MQTKVQRVVYPRPDLPQDGWISYVVRTSGVQLFWAAIDQLQQTSTSLEFTLYASRER